MTLFRHFLRKVTKSFQSHKAFARQFALCPLWTSGLFFITIRKTLIVSRT